MAAKVVCQEYSSSLEDLTFNSKPLINMLTMLAEENSQYATEIIKLIEKRIYEVTIDKKLPSLYLMDSIVKNIGKDYITAVTQCIVAIFTHVFEKGDEKVRMSLYKLRNTWPSFFAAKQLHEIDCSVHKIDPGWPVVEPPPASPSIHINPKFLSKPKIEERVQEPKAASSEEEKIRGDFQRKKVELEELQGEQMRLQMQELAELKLKHDLIKKKQEQERQELIKQQQEQILQMRLLQENITSTETRPTDTETSDSTSQLKTNARDPRLERNVMNKDPRLERNVMSKAKTTAIAETTTTESRERTGGDIASKNVEAVKKHVEHVGFDSEFVPLDKPKNDIEVSVDSAYNRDRPLGNKRYFTKHSTDENTIRDNSTEHNPVIDTEMTHKRALKNTRENTRENNRGGKRLRGGVPHREKSRNSSKIPLEKEPRHIHDDRKNRRRNQDGDIKEKLTSVRGRARDTRRRGGGYVGNEIEKRMHHRNKIQENDEGFAEGVPGKFPRREDWSRGRVHKRPRRGRLGARGELDEREIRNRHEFPPTVDNTDRMPERPPRKWLPDSSNTFERGILGEPPVKKNRSSPPRPLFSEKEISEIRERRHGSPPHGFPHGPPHDFDQRQNPPDWRDQEPGFEPDFRPRWHPDEAHRSVHPEFFDRPFHGGGPLDVREPRFPHPDDLPRHEGFPPRRFQPEFHHHPHFAGGLEIPLELTLDNESEILRSAERRLSTGDLSEEQHRELLEKLHQLYELQKWQRRHSIDNPLQNEPELPPPHQLTLHPPGGLPPHPSLPISKPSDDNRGFPVQPMEEVVFEQPVPGVVDFQPPPSNVTGAGFQAAPPAEQLLPANRHDGLDATYLDVKDEAVEAPPSNLVMEKQTVDDLFKRLMDFGIITKVTQEALESSARAMTPPVVPETMEIPVPEIKLTLDDLRRRYDGVIIELYRGTQCSSCGLRFKEADNDKYRQHLDWHFRMNRKEKETVAAHRNWFITEDDWMAFESSEDPELKARSSVFEAGSDDESENSEEDVEGGCPVLREDTESESVCDICLEKFEQFWDETSEEWHYKNAVRIDGKTYHYLCYQDAKETENVEDDTEPTDEVDVCQGDNEGSDKSETDEDDHKEEENKKNEADTKETSCTNDKTSNVTENTEPVAGGELGVNDANKEEKKTECS